LDYLLEVALPVPLDRTFSYRLVDGGQEPAEPCPEVGDLVSVPFGRRRQVTGLVVGVEPLEPGTDQVDGFQLRDVVRRFGPEYRVTGDRLALARWLAEYYALPLGEVVPLFHPPAPGTRLRARRKDPDPAFPTGDAAGITLTGAQQQAVDLARGHLEDGKFGALLLHGVTGSGKTEVYLTVIEQALASGRGAIFLLPEIALTPQMLARITARFGGEVAAIHSGLSAGQRCLVHEQAARGEVKVVVGPRSALFAPVRDLGVIVVDEEHEHSYKQDEKPRYHARHAALVRGREAAAVVILGSATPDLETMENARSGRYQLVELPDRMGGELPRVEVVDMRGSLALEGFSPALADAMRETLAAGRQIILYYNRRGFARVLQCRDCGEVIECPNCDIGLTYHLRPRRLLCHYCDLVREVPAQCPACRSEEFLPQGGGTEKVELNLQAHFPEARVLRLDRDTTGRRGSHREILSAFARRKADILVGTQMVAKGHHFPGVGLVGVLAADDGLGLPDFRAAERTFQLLTQVAGRSGRTEAGRVVFQTFRPEDPVITAASRHDYQAFLEQEMPVREALGYPPCRRLLRIGISGRRLGATEEAAHGLAEALRRNLGSDQLTVLGPAPAVFPRLNDRFRFQILLKGSLGREAKAWLIRVLGDLKENYRGIDVVHDVDPVSVY
jgi:primosomal protein N' (replication factor Y)